MNEIAAVIKPAPTTKPVESAMMTFRQLTAIQQLAQSVLNLKITEFRTVAAELHADSHSVGVTPHEVGDLLFGWATRTLDGINIS